MLAAMRSPMRRSAAADSSELSPSVGNVPVVPVVPASRGAAGAGVLCVKAAGLATSAATSRSFLKRIDTVKCDFLSVWRVQQAHMMTNRSKGFVTIWKCHERRSATHPL